MDDTGIDTANKMAADVYSSLLWGNEKVLSYLRRERGFTDDTIRRFHLGYANSTSSILINTLQGNNLKWEHLATSNGDADYFHNRIMIPNVVMGSVVFFSGRAFPSGSPKYLHQRGGIRYLFNEGALGTKPYVFLVESPMSAIALSQYGFPAVAKYGIGARLLRHIHRLTRVYLVPDIDQSRVGEVDALVVGAYLKNNGVEDVRVVTLDGHKDAGDYIVANGKDRFKKLAKAAVQVSEMPEIKVDRGDGPETYSWDWAVEKYFAEKKEGSRNTEAAYIKRNVSLVDVVRDYASVSTGPTMSSARCPIHKDRNPSFKIYHPQDGTDNWYCYGCGNGGDVISFVMMVEDVSFKDAIDLIKSRYLKHTEKK